MNRRLPPQPHEWIDRTRPVSFTLEGQTFKGFDGDVISSALWANGQSVLGRSFKYHRPRGLLSMADHDINAMYDTPERPNVRGDVTPIEAGMSLAPVNTFGTLAKDKGAWLQTVSRFLPVGFYYQTFHKPKALFPFWEKIIRRMAGLGQVNTDWPAERSVKRYHHTDVAIIGAGVAGLSAAKEAMNAGLDVLLVDENPHIGGSLDTHYPFDEHADGLRESVQALEASPNLTVMTRSYAVGYYGDHWLGVKTPSGLVKVSAKSVVVATGVFEQPGVFRNNDLPGVMNASGAERLVARYGVAPCRVGVVLSANPEGVQAALNMIRAGVTVKALLHTGRLSADVRASLTEVGVHVYEGVESPEALGKQTLQGVQFEAGSQTHQLECDGLMMSFGWAPAGALLYQAGARFSYSESLAQLLPVTLPEGVFACGRINGVFDLQDKAQDGARAGRQAALFAKGQPLDPGIDEAGFRAKQAHSHPYPIWSHPKGKNFVDMDEDIQLKDLKAAIAQGFDNVELLKRYSTLGMGPSQGKHSNMNGIRILARLTQKTIVQAGSTTARPMFHPVPVADLAGQRFRPRRQTPMHDWHATHQAQWMETGPWYRPEYYATESDATASIDAEIDAVRRKVGLIDVSTLGKLTIFGPDAAEFMDRAYTMRMANMKVGTTRYGLMVDDSGVVIDDGVVVRFDEETFYVTTTSTGSDQAYQLLTRKVIEWGLDVIVLNRTGQLAAMNLAGPFSQALLQEVVTQPDFDLSLTGFPYLAARETEVCGCAVTLVRVGFVGELGYEIHCQQADALTIWQGLFAKGERYGLRPFGVEAQRQLRLEKGHIIVGQDTDGLTHPFEASLKWAVHFKKPYFIGRSALQRHKARTQRQLVGFELPLHQPLPEVSNLVIAGGQIRGRVTSVGRSRTLNKIVGLAMVDVDWLQNATLLPIRLSHGPSVEAKRVSLPFYDAQGERQNQPLSLDEPQEANQ
ncbi:FAD-dependent oxidoreductase [Thiomicrospira sp. WB1]|uniref:FAD-dependent oxidoreductase n=1 Tax=Thiomicrospira sp. WB1 TaxID=1685380 RepID=UPI0007498104|nr:FAD-dependent oxidoreductase [Thiomicrospira sp. WB1]KUJ72494.1 aminomethyltransferase [Thiomicrospira sp. WB1]